MTRLGANISKEKNWHCFLLLQHSCRAPRKVVRETTEQFCKKEPHKKVYRHRRQHFGAFFPHFFKAFSMAPHAFCLRFHAQILLPFFRIPSEPREKTRFLCDTEFGVCVCFFIFVFALHLYTPEYITSSPAVFQYSSVYRHQDSVYAELSKGKDYFNLCGKHCSYKRFSTPGQGILQHGDSGLFSFCLSALQHGPDPELDPRGFVLRS